MFPHLSFQHCNVKQCWFQNISDRNPHIIVKISVIWWHIYSISILLLKLQVSVTQGCRWWAWLAGRWYWRAGRLAGDGGRAGRWRWPWSKWAWSTHATVSTSQEQTLSGTGAVQGLAGRGDGYQCGLDWGRSSINTLQCTIVAWFYVRNIR